MKIDFVNNSISNEAKQLYDEGLERNAITRNNKNPQYFISIQFNFQFKKFYCPTSR